jgi:DNA polymerase-1
MVSAGYPFEKLKIRKTATGYSTDKEALGMFAKYKKWCEFPRMVLQHKAYSKIAGTYVAGKAGRGDDEVGGMLQYLDANDRIHANFNLWSPRTGRYSCNKPSLQVWPRPIKDMPNIRNFICSEEGWELTEMDYSQLEQCVVAAISRDLVLIEKIMNGVDLHCFNAVELGRKLGTIEKDVTYEYMMTAVGKGLDLVEQVIDYDSIPEEVKAKFKELRTQAKAIGFGLNYGKTAITFAEDFGIEIEEAEDMVDAYFNLYRGMKKWRDGIVEEALTRGYITLISGRRRRFTQAVDWINSNFAEGLWSTKKLSEEISRQAMNSPIQGGAHDIFEPAKIRIIKRIKAEGLQSRLLLSIHDGMIFENPVEERERLKKIIAEEAIWSLNTDSDYQVNFKVDVDTFEITLGDTKAHWYGNKLKH